MASLKDIKSWLSSTDKQFLDLGAAAERITVLFPGWYYGLVEEDFFQAAIDISGTIFVGRVVLCQTTDSLTKNSDVLLTVFYGDCPEPTEPPLNRYAIHLYQSVVSNPQPANIQTSQERTLVKRRAKTQQQLKHAALQRSSHQAQPRDASALLPQTLVFSNQSSWCKHATGRCGFLFPDSLAGEFIYEQRLQRYVRILHSSASARLQTKVQNVFSQIQSLDPGTKVEQASFDTLEQVFFQLVCGAFGLKNYQPAFSALAQSYPYEQINALFGNWEFLHSPAKHYEQFYCPFGRMLKDLGFFRQNNGLKVVDDIFLPHEKEQITLATQSLSEDCPPLITRYKATYFAGHPVNRLIGLLEHLYATRKIGLLRSWLQVIRANFAAPSLPIFKNAMSVPMSKTGNKKVTKNGTHKNTDHFSGNIQDNIAALFAPIDLPDQNVPVLHKQVTGQDRIAIIVINAVVPFLFAWGEITQNQELLDCLFQFYWSYPGERQQNAKTTEMEKRINSPKISKKFKKSLAYSQAMLQIKNELCLTYDQGCQRCQLHKWLA